MQETRLHLSNATHSGRTDANKSAVSLPSYFKFQWKGLPVARGSEKNAIEVYLLQERQATQPIIS
jgi:hypothetical protein